MSISAAEPGDRDAIVALLADVGLSTMGLFEDAAWILVARAAAEPTSASAVAPHAAADPTRASAVAPHASADALHAAAEPTRAAADGLSGIVGVAAVERYGKAGLLRSVATTARVRGTGLGRELVDRAEARCHEEGVSALYLLTETAEGFFASRGYSVVDRSRVPAEVRASTQFVALCPTSATVMVRVPEPAAPAAPAAAAAPAAPAASAAPAAPFEAR